MSIPTVNPLWRPNATGPAPNDRNDRELIRQYADFPASESGLVSITEQMNMVATASPAAVAKIQSWIDEIEELEADHALKVADGTAFLGNVQEYEGLRPGYSPTRQELLKKADVAEWDVESLARVKIKTGQGGGIGTATGMIYDRIAALKDRVLKALVLGEAESPSGWGSFTIERS